jgi:hypothetical protein
VSGHRSHLSSLGLVVPARIEGEVPQQLAVYGQHPHAQSVNEEDQPLCLVGVSHADVVKACAVAKGHLAVLVESEPPPGTVTMALPPAPIVGRRH